MARLMSPGDRISDVYVVEEVIGEGGMAVVARAEHTHYRHRVAIKMMLPEAARSGEVRKRFERERRTLLRLHSEHTVRIHGAGVHENLPYMALELLEGIDLAELLKTKGPLETDVAVLYLLQTCHAVAEAHSLGIVHRDLKPANLFLTRRDDGSPCVKVLDFGISKVSDRGPGSAEESLTQTRAVMGSPFYMAPEQLLSARDADARSDIWALGVILYELLSSSLPFAAQDTEGVVQRILHDGPTPLRKLKPMISGSLEGAVMRCLRRRPQERYANVADFAQRLADFGPSHSREGLEAIYRHVPPSHRAAQHSIPPELGPPPSHAAGEHDDTTLYLQGSAARRSWSGWAAAALALATFALGSGLGWVMSLEVDPTRSPAATPAPAPADARPRGPAEEVTEEAPPPSSPVATIDLDEPEAAPPAPPPAPVEAPPPAPRPRPPPVVAPPPRPPAGTTTSPPTTEAPPPRPTTSSEATASPPTPPPPSEPPSPPAQPPSGDDGPPAPDLPGKVSFD